MIQTDKLFSMTDQAALVTGASRGIGRAIAEALGNAGAFVIGTATSESGAASISQMFDEAGIRGCGKVLDIGERSSIDRLIAELKDEKLSVTVLVNNAGITRDNLLLRMKPEEWADIINTNLTGAVELTRQCLRGMMKARQGADHQHLIGSRVDG